MKGMVTFKWLVLCSLGDRERQQNRLHVHIAMGPADKYYQVVCRTKRPLMMTLYLRRYSCLAILNNKLVYTFQFICWSRSWNRDLTEMKKRTFK